MRRESLSEADYIALSLFAIAVFFISSENSVFSLLGS